MTVSEWAGYLNGRGVSWVLYPDEIKDVKKDGLVIAWVPSDNFLQFEGEITEEEWVPFEGRLWIAPNKCLTKDFTHPELPEIKPVFCPKNKYGTVYATWEILTAIPHETFNILDDGETYCIGVVFKWNDVFKKKEEAIEA